MALVLTIILLVAALTMGAWIGFGYLDLFVMPAACPKCSDATERWYEGERPYFRCRACGTRFREGEGGTLIRY